MTSQRRLLLEVLTECDAHVDAEGIYALAKERDPNISLATVYRTLKMLKEAGIVQERILDREGQKHYYELAAKAHYHFTCLECGRVMEFESPLIEQASHELALAKRGEKAPPSLPMACSRTRIISWIVQPGIRAMSSRPIRVKNARHCLVL